MVARVRGRLLLGTALALGVLLCAAGSASAAATAQPRIIGGQPADIGTYPYQVRISITGIGECGGVIRDPTHVLTAGHCASESGLTFLPQQFQISYGSSTRGASERTTGVASVSVPPQYLAGDSTYDAAVLTLPQALTGYGAAGVNGIPFATGPELTDAIRAGGGAVATGWGLTTENGSTSNQLEAVTLPLRGDDVCQAFFGPAYSADRMVCAGGAGTAPANNPDTCQGDSGGPLALSTSQGLKLVGLTSFGNGCGEASAPAAYTQVSNFELCAFLGGGAACDAAPVVAPRVVRDTTKPSARVSKVSCKRRRCTFHVHTSDNSGHVASIRMRLYRNVRSCKTVRGKRRCKTVKRSRKLSAKRITGGFSATSKLSVARYRLDAIATDTARNASKTARKRFRVKKT
jgi:trypsin